MLRYERKKARFSTGDKTMLRYIHPDSGMSITKAEAAGGKLKITTSGIYPSGIVGQYLLIFGTDYSFLRGYHAVTAVSGNEVTLNTQYGGPTLMFASNTVKSYMHNDFQVTGQATDANGNVSTDAETFSTIGMQDEQSGGRMSYDCSLEVLADSNNDLAYLLGVMDYATVKTISIDETKPYHAHVLLESYTSTDEATASFKFATVYEFVKWNGWNTKSPGGSTGKAVWSLTGTAVRKYIAGAR